MQSEGPSESDMNNLGIYLLFSFSFVMAALVELFVLVIISGRIRSNNDRASENVVRPFENSSDDRESGNVGELEDSVGENGIEGGASFKSLINKIDKWAFWIFNFAFIIFNCGYWMKCLA